jgi:hypothetical protein
LGWIHVQSLWLLIEGLLLSVRYTLGGLTLVYLLGACVVVWHGLSILILAGRKISSPADNIPST